MEWTVGRVQVLVGHECDSTTFQSNESLVAKLGSRATTDSCTHRIVHRSIDATNDWRKAGFLAIDYGHGTWYLRYIRSIEPTKIPSKRFFGYCVERSGGRVL